MIKKLGWIALLVILCTLTLSDIYSGMSEPDILQPTHPTFMSVFILIGDLLNIIACITIVLRKYIFNPRFWQVALACQITLFILVHYYEFTAGGYSTNDMLTLSTISFWTALVLFLPLLKCSFDKSIAKNTTHLSQG